MLEQGRRLRAIDVNLAEHGKADAVVQLAELHDLVIRARVLFAELVAGEAQNGQAALVIALVELLQTFELRGEATFGGRVNDQQHLAPIFFQWLFRTGGGSGNKFIDGTHGWLLGSGIRAVADPFRRVDG